MSAGLKFNSDTYYSNTYDVIAYNDNAEVDECTYIVAASFVSYDDARDYAEDEAHDVIGIRPPHAEVSRTLAWLASTVR